jgi:ABC-type nitrate/sulfonate/bicarbonate transport system ATPase subunit
MIHLDSVSFAYPGSVPIFQDFSWKVERGEAWAVIGPSGCGKSTLLALIAGLRQPTSGKILIDGVEYSRPRPQTGLIIQDYGLLPWATVRENASLGTRIRSFYGPDGTHAPAIRERGSEKADANRRKVDYWLERLGLTSVADQYPGQISGGQRQRTAIARTLVLEPDILLMDEPFSSLDAPTRESLQSLTLELSAERGLTLILVTHAIEEAAALGKQVLALGHAPIHTGKIIPNPGAGGASYRDSQAYGQICRELRAFLEAQ